MEFLRESWIKHFNHSLQQSQPNKEQDWDIIAYDIVRAHDDKMKGKTKEKQGTIFMI